MNEILRDGAFFMRLALDEAKKCAALDEVPVGAVIVRGGEVVAAAGNCRESTPDASGHAEISAIRSACAARGGWNLHDCELYLTLEPCVMCAGAISNARIARVFYGASDSKAGAYGGAFDVRSLPLNHHPQVESGLLADDCSALLKDFFSRKRQRGKRWEKPTADN